MFLYSSHFGSELHFRQRRINHLGFLLTTGTPSMIALDTLIVCVSIVGKPAIALHHASVPG